MFSEGSYSLVDTLLDLLDRTLDRLEAITKLFLELISITLRSSNKRGLGEKDICSDMGSAYDDKDTDDDDMDSTFGGEEMC
jgi:hypothetical protein